MSHQHIAGWGRYPWIEADVLQPRTSTHVRQTVLGKSSLLAQGLRRSYGDSCLAPTVLETTQLDCCLDFNPETGVLRCQAGVSLERIQALLVPHGWFLPVTPGTRFVTVGGAIASDVHGKNHHHDGCFSQYVDQVELMTARGEVVPCSLQEHPDLFHATCGGMGLTGVIIAATVRLKPIRNSYIDQTVIQAPNLDAALDVFGEQQHFPYSVAWIDCVARGSSLGRSLVMLGQHADDGDALTLPAPARLRIPANFPNCTLNRLTVSAFNNFYYHRIRRRQCSTRIHYAPFFYPLDAVLEWNKLYGKSGFTQYQFVLPYSAGRDGLRQILAHIADSGKGSFLAVLKAMGAANDNLLSFPLPGYTLALDFKIDAGVFELLDDLDAMVHDFGGRIYLAKDCRLSPQSFRKGYPHWNRFQDVREKWEAIGKFSSLQSQRLGLDP